LQVSGSQMKTLYILRHAKSSWDDPEMSDFERPLNDRGKKTAPFIGELMAKNGLEPDIILSSPAMRAKATAQMVKRAAKIDAEIRYEDRIYEASPHTLSQVVSETDNAYRSVMLVGHNPGIEGFIRYLTGNLEPMPTAALAVISLQIDSWDLINDGRGELKRIFRPREEMK